MIRRLTLIFLFATGLCASAGASARAETGLVRMPPAPNLAPASSPAPVLRTPGDVPATRFPSPARGAIWTRTMLSALDAHASALTRTVPADIEAWCPAYETQDEKGRAAFWAGLASALAKHESTYRPRAVGGGGRWYGLLQILPATARGYGCHARSGEALLSGGANLSCALRIFAVTVPRDGVIAARAGRWRGIAADWGPMRIESKRRDMANWTRAQSYCTRLASRRPQMRPARLAAAALK